MSEVLPDRPAARSVAMRGATKVLGRAAEVVDPRGCRHIGELRLHSKFPSIDCNVISGWTATAIRTSAERSQPGG
jgi:hypothetical protein